MNILLTSVGRRTYLIDYFKEAMCEEGKVFALNNTYTYSLSHADGYVIAPSIYDDNYIDFVIGYCKDNKITAVISLFDIDLPILAKNKSKFENNGIQLLVSDLDVINICNDKWETYKFLKHNKINTPKTFLNIEDALKEIKEKKLDFPLIIKPRWGMGSIGIYKAENMGELKILYKKLTKEIFNTYLKYESSAAKSKCVLIQEKINGEEFGLDVFNDLAGNYITTIAKKKIAMRSGETDIAEIVENDKFIKYAKILSEKLHHIGNLDVDCFVTSTKKIYVLELNCRFGGQYPFSHLAGVNFPQQIINWLKGEPTRTNLLTPVIGIKSCKDLTPVKI